MPGQPDRIHFGGDRCCQHEDCLDFPGRLNIACVHVIDLEKSTKVHVQWLGCHGVSSLWRDGGEAFTLGVLSRSRIVLFLMSIDVFDQDSFIADLVVGLRTGRTSANVDPKNRTKAQSVLSPECLRAIARAHLNLRTLLRESDHNMVGAPWQSFQDMRPTLAGSNQQCGPSTASGLGHKMLHQKHAALAAVRFSGANVLDLSHS